MIYATSKAPEGAQDLKRARRSANFIMANMMARDSRGIYFKSAVNSHGIEVPSGRSYTFSFEQSYPIAGLLALYSADPTANADLLPIAREAAQSYWNRFWDPKFGGLFYYYNFVKIDNSNDQGLIHKSYQSNIYPISSFLFALRKADPQNEILYNDWINNLLQFALDHIVQYQNQRPTGWLLERLNPDFSVDESYKMTEAGHVTQLAWVLGVAVRDGIVTDPTLKAACLETLKSLLAKFVMNGGVSDIGAVIDAFDHDTGRPIVDSAGLSTSAWWSNLEAIIAFDFAIKNQLISKEQTSKFVSALGSLTNAYFKYFVDHQQGGEFFRIRTDTGEVVDSTKGGPGKSAYHITEAYLYLLEGPHPD
jgi:mannose/cellobiose epimerase-like protein (N-acyl-D-glucosamine 2-epimerase family)